MQTIILVNLFETLRNISGNTYYSIANEELHGKRVTE